MRVYLHVWCVRGVCQCCVHGCACVRAWVCTAAWVCAWVCAWCVVCCVRASCVCARVCGLHACVRGVFFLLNLKKSNDFDQHTSQRLQVTDT
jgi:hypothetical protein